MDNRWFCIDNQYYNLSKFWKLEPLAIAPHGVDKRFVILGYLNFHDPTSQIDLQQVKKKDLEVLIGEDSFTTYDDCLTRIMDIIKGKYDVA